MKMKAAELNYLIYDKELPAITKASEECRLEIAGTKEPTMVFTNPCTLQ